MVLGARVLAQFGDDRTRYQDARARRCCAGTAPITRASGTRRVVLARVARNRRLADAMYLWAFSALTRSSGARRCYDAHRARGATHHQAVSVLGTARSIRGPSAQCSRRCCTPMTRRCGSWSTPPRSAAPASDACPVKIPIVDGLLGLRRRQAADMSPLTRAEFAAWSALWGSSAGFAASRWAATALVPLARRARAAGERRPPRSRTRWIKTSRTDVAQGMSASAARARWSGSPKRGGSGDP